MGGLGDKALIETKRALSRFRNTSLRSLARTLWRAVRLRFREPAPGAPGRAERIVVTLTTTPARARGLALTLRSLLDQQEPPDRILLALPHESRVGQRYPDIESLGLPPGVDLLRCADEGPATKLLPALAAEPEALLVVADDDVIYPRNFIATLLDAHRRHPKAALGYRGVKLREGVPFAALDHVFATGVEEAREVDVLFGTWGYMVPAGSLGRGVFDLASAPDELRWVDDIWISGHLARNGIPRWVVRANELPVETLNVLRSSLTGGVNASGHNDATGLHHFRADW